MIIFFVRGGQNRLETFFIIEASCVLCKLEMTSANSLG